MARPIKPTPILQDRDARKFNRRIEKRLKTPLKVTKAPDLEKAKDLAFASVNTCSN